MRETQFDKACSDELFAVVENGLRDERRWTAAPTAVLRLKEAVRQVAGAEACLGALEELRSMLDLAIAERSHLSERCRLLEAALDEPAIRGTERQPKVHVIDPSGSATGRCQIVPSAASPGADSGN